MERHIVEILEIGEVTHNVKYFRFRKPDGYQFHPGQATDVSINKPGLEEEVRPFTFTCLAEAPYLEFTIKRYADHDGITNKIHQLKVGDPLIIRDSWGAISYKGPGCFIAGGAGITPFIAILRRLHKDNQMAGNRLIFSNKTEDDIIYHDELKTMLGENLKNVITDSGGQQSKDPSVIYGRIDEALLTKELHDFTTPFYVCGPDRMIHDINDLLTKHGAKPDSVVFEK